MNVAKYLYIVILVGILSFLFACQSNRLSKKTRVPADFIFQVEHSGCYGTCPIYQMRLNAKREVRWVGKRFTENIGTWQKIMPEDQFAVLLKYIKEATLESYKDSYDDPNISDIPATTLTFTQNEKTKTIVCRYKVPTTLVQFIDSAEAIIGKQNFVKVSDETNY
ncbi:MAG: DUF6438 domain-containing protein [Bacteroidia bacterium]|nr:DUF6438 domain-containing protein [Bacteroidia bacterium]